MKKNNKYMNKPTQKQINELCLMIQHQGEEITIDKVKALLDGEYSIVEIAKKVLLFKNGKSELDNKNIDATIHANQVSLLDKINGLLSNANLDQSNHDLALSLKMLFHEHTKKDKSLEHDIYVSLKFKYDHIERNYLSINKKYDELLQKYKNIKDKYYALSQQYTKLSRLSKNSYMQTDNAKRSNERKSISEQLSYAQSENFAGFDFSKGVIVVKGTLDNEVIRALNNQSAKALIQADALYNFEKQYWELSNYRLITIQTLERNNFIFSNELINLIEYSRKNTDKN